VPRRTRLRIAALVALTALFVLPGRAHAQVVSTFAAGLTEPRGLAFDASGNVYVSTIVASVGAVQRIPAGGGPATVFALGFSNPRGLAFSASGDLYVADVGPFEGAPEGRVWRVTPGGVKTIIATGFLGPAFLAFEAEGRGDLYLSERTGRRLRRITPSGTVFDYGPPLGGVTEFVGQFVFEPSGDVLVAVTGSIKRLSGGGSSLTTFCSGLGDVFGLARASDGELFVSRHASADIVRVTPTGLASPYAGSTVGCGDGLLLDAQFRAPLGLVMDDSRLFIADRDCGAVRTVERPTVAQARSWGRLKAAYH
jgi:hypothetical protein